MHARALVPLVVLLLATTHLLAKDRFDSAASRRKKSGQQNKAAKTGIVEGDGGRNANEGVIRGGRQKTAIDQGDGGRSASGIAQGDGARQKTAGASGDVGRQSDTGHVGDGGRTTSASKKAATPKPTATPKPIHFDGVKGESTDDKHGE